MKNYMENDMQSGLVVYRHRGFEVEFFAWLLVSVCKVPWECW